MFPVSQAQSFGDIRVEGPGSSLTINQVIQIAVDAIKTRPFESSSPYVGLRRFEERNRDFFFGRDQLVARLLSLVAQRNLVLLAGASGSGKSSLVRAGLLPQLTARLPQGRVLALTMTPDIDPFAKLRGALGQLGISERMLQALEARSAGCLVETLRSQRPPEELWLLFIDQFEEIFTRCESTALRESFILGLTELAQIPQSEIKIVLVIRTDFLDRLGPYPEFGVLAQQGMEFVLDMQASELRAAIEQPAARHGVVFEAGLVDQIIADLKGRPGALPLLQYTLNRLWHEDSLDRERMLKARSYQLIGGIEGALQQRADTIYRFADAQNRIGRSSAEQDAMRRIFLSVVDLTSPGADGRAVSRWAQRAAFSQPEEERIIDELVDEKLLVSNAPPLEKWEMGNGATIELAHEALLFAWPQLKGPMAHLNGKQSQL